MMRLLPAGAVLVLCLSAWGQLACPGAELRRPLPAVRRVVIFCVDGLSPDCLLRAEAPVLHGLLREGAGTLMARTVPAAVTLPAHVSMLTGAAPGKHRIEWNDDPPTGVSGYPAVPTIFELATRAGYTTALVVGKPKLVALCRPGTVAYPVILRGAEATDANVSAEAAKIIAGHRPDLLFLHFPGVDGAGHTYGWGSPEQLAAIAAADAQIGAVLAALERSGLRQSTVIIVTADHGGEGLAHGSDVPGSQVIPWLVAGPGVRRGRDLAGPGGTAVRIEDTAATASWLLGLELPASSDGRPVTAAFATGG